MASMGFGRHVRSLQFTQIQEHPMGKSVVSGEDFPNTNPSRHHPYSRSQRTFGTAKANGANGHAKVQEGKDLARGEWERNGKTTMAG